MSLANVRVMSDKALYILHNLANMDVGFLARYGVILSGGLYEPVRPGTSEAGEVENAQFIVTRELQDMALEATLDRMAVALERLASQGTTTCGCTVGEGPESSEGTEGGQPPTPVGDIVYTEPDPATVDRKCKTANALWEAMEGTIAELNRVDVVSTIVYGLTFVIGVVTAAIGVAVAAVVGGLMVATAGSISVLAARLMAGGVDLGALEAALNTRRDNIICAMFEATSASEARDDIIAILEGEPLNANTIDAFSLLLNNTFLNVLWFDTEGLAAHLDGQTIYYDCSGCATLGPIIWYPTMLPGDAVAIGGGPIGIGDLTPDGTERTLQSVPIEDAQGTPIGHAMTFGVPGYTNHNQLIGLDPTALGLNRIYFRCTAINGGAPSAWHNATDRDGQDQFIINLSAANMIIGLNDSTYAGYQQSNLVEGPFTVDIIIDTVPT